MMTTIDVDLLSNVTGGARGQQQQPQQQSADQGEQPQGGGMPPWLDGLFSFLKSSQFGQIVNSFQDWFSQFSQGGQQQAQQQQPAQPGEAS